MVTFPIQAPAFNGHSRVVDPGNAFEWLRQGWALFVVNPGLWIALTIVLFVALLVLLFGLSFVRLLGPLVILLLGPMLGAGMLLACRKVADGETPGIPDLFAGIRHNTGDLLRLGVLFMAAMLLILAIVVVLGSGSLAGGLKMGQAVGIGLAFGGLIFAALLSLALLVPLFMAILFAPALVFFNNMPPVEALKASFNACQKNALPCLAYGLIAMALTLFAALPVFLGFLVLIPVLSGSVYASYRDIFVAN